MEAVREMNDSKCALLIGFRRYDHTELHSTCGTTTEYSLFVSVVFVSCAVRGGWYLVSEFLTTLYQMLSLRRIK